MVQGDGEVPGDAPSTRRLVGDEERHHRIVEEGTRQAGRQGTGVGPVGEAHWSGHGAHL